MAKGKRGEGENDARRASRAFLGRGSLRESWDCDGVLALPPSSRLTASIGAERDLPHVLSMSSAAAQVKECVDVVSKHS